MESSLVMIRILDVTFSILGLIFSFPILVIIFFIAFLETGSPLFVQERLGKGKKCFWLVKFRTMYKDTRSVATHLASTSSVTRLGKFLRKFKLDELPQLWNVLKGEMSLVGPRPNLPNQNELIIQRDLLNIYEVSPGITGLAQINNIDMSNPVKLAKVDQLMIENMTIKYYLLLLMKTALGNGKGDVLFFKNKQ